MVLRIIVTKFLSKCKLYFSQKKKCKLYNHLTKENLDRNNPRMHILILYGIRLLPKYKVCHSIKTPALGWVICFPFRIDNYTVYYINLYLHMPAYITSFLF